VSQSRIWIFRRPAPSAECVSWC